MINTPEVFQLLENASLFRGVPRDILEHLIQKAKKVTLKPGQKLLARGMINENVYLVVTGHLTVQITPSHIDQPIAIVTPGECVGEMSVLVDSLVSADVIASTDCELLAIDYTTFWSMIETSNEVARNMLNILVRRVRVGNLIMAENLQQYDSYGERIHFDNLTGLYNRQGIHSKFDRLLHRCVVDKEPVSLVVLEIDESEKLENNLLELRGDQALRSIAQTMLTFLRPDDHAARLIGNKFAVLLSNTSLEDACSTADRLRTEIRASRIALPNGNLLPPFTISAGVSQALPDDTWSSLVARSEIALEKAVAAGRNQVSSTS